MRRTLLVMIVAGVVAMAPASAQTDGYRLVPNWPTLPPVSFGLKTLRRHRQARRKRQHAAQRGRPVRRGRQGLTNHPASPAWPINRIASTCSIAAPSR
jgi:hypothetical protein